MTKQESYRQKQAFEFYYNLKGRRTFKPVAEEFEVSEQSVSNWCKRYNWEQRVIDRDFENAQKAAKEQNIDAGDIIHDLVYLISQYKNVMLYQMYKDKMKLPKGFLKDLDTLLKLSEFMKSIDTDKPDSNISQNTIYHLGIDLGDLLKTMRETGSDKGGKK